MATIDTKNVGVLKTGVLNETLGHGIVTLPPITCSIGLDSFAITNTRSRHEDTDFVTLSLAIANRPALSQTRALGDRNNGNFPLDMIFSSVSIAPGEIAVLTYGMVNSGHQSPGEVTTALEDAFKALATKGAQIAATAIGGAIGAELGASIGTVAVPIIGSALGALAGLLVGGAFGLLFADCDGPVAAAVHTLTYDQIKAALAGGNGLVQTDNQPGIDSADGCGSNSQYTVTWSVR